MSKNKSNTWDLLQQKYPAGQYALIQEVSDAAGFNRSGSADYFVMSLWPSRGLSLTCIELKSSRTDWLRELKQPSKQENFFKHSDYFYLFTDNENVARLEEIPETWGWMTIEKGRIVTKKEAPKLTPVELSRNFLAAILKRAADKKDFIHNSQIEEQIEERVNQKTESNRASVEYWQKEYEELAAKVREFENASGIGIRYSWKHPKEVGEAVRYILRDNGIEGYQKDLLNLEQRAKAIAEAIHQEIVVIDKTQTKINDEISSRAVEKTAEVV